MTTSLTAETTDTSPDPTLQLSWVWLGAWAVLTAAVTFEVARHGFVQGSGAEIAVLTSVAVTFFVAPDLTFLVGIGQPAEPGYLPRRAVPWYNAMHRLWVPLAFTVVVAATMTPQATSTVALFVGGLSWMAHITLDRASGYGLRNPDGSR
ncbi:MAG: DUF4260 domain-containing protein [Acidimicrobiia bacterium]|nr:DUF4260 domain-containing protein [Acidimicrobiia bacterium]